MRRFNTEGPVRPEKHYCIPPLARVDLDNILGLIRDDRYFVLHAPRQTGKTSVLLALRDTLNRSGKYNCVYVNIEVGQAGREDTARSMRAVLGRIASRARMSGDGFLEEVWTDILARHGPDDALCEALTRWAEAGSKPLVLLIDEIDALVGDTLLSVLRQLRSGYDLRPDGFPQSIVLCGVRDVRDYRIRSGSRNEVVAGGSAFNIKAESLRLGDFTEAEIRDLVLQQHNRVRTDIHPGGLGHGLGTDAGTAMARERAMRRGLSSGAGSLPSCRTRGNPECPGTSDPQRADASRPACRQAPRGQGPPRHRAFAEWRPGAQPFRPVISNMSGIWD